MSETEHPQYCGAKKVIHLDLSKCLILISTVEVRRRGCQNSVLGWEVHDFDADFHVFCAVLALHKDVLCRSNSQYIGSRQDLTATQRQKPSHVKATCHIIRPGVQL